MPKPASWAGLHEIKFARALLQSLKCDQPDTQPRYQSAPKPS